MDLAAQADQEIEETPAGPADSVVPVVLVARAVQVALEEQAETEHQDLQVEQVELLFKLIHQQMLKFI